jgi:hypothetical protein
VNYLVGASKKEGRSVGGGSRKNEAFDGGGCDSHNLSHQQTCRLHFACYLLACKQALTTTIFKAQSG